MECHHLPTEAELFLKEKLLQNRGIHRGALKRPRAADPRLTWAASCYQHEKGVRKPEANYPPRSPLALPPPLCLSPPLLGDMMKFPETKTHSPFYKMPSPLVEKAPMVPFISSFLRRRPGPGLFVQMGGRERAQGWRGRGRGGGEGGRRWLGRGVGAGEVSGGRDEWTGIVPREAPAAGRQGFGKDGFPSSGSAPRAPPSLQRTRSLPFRCCSASCGTGCGPGPAS